MIRRIVVIGGALLVLTSCVGTYDPRERGAQGGVGGAALGCATGALMTVWGGPIAAIGCGLGALAGADIGAMLGVATAPNPLPPPPPPPLPLR